MLRVGITGGIGTGKSFVCQLFGLLGIPIYQADDRTKYLIAHNIDLKEKIKIHFGEASYKVDGTYNKDYISSILFSDRGAKALFESLVHPEVLKDNLAWFDTQDSAGHPYAIKEAALIFETGGEKYLDKVIVIDAPLPVRLDRLKKRDGKSESEILNRIKNQWSQEVKLTKADYIIQNDGHNPVIPQVHKIHQELIRLSTVPL